MALSVDVMPPENNRKGMASHKVPGEREGGRGLEGGPGVGKSSERPTSISAGSYDKKVIGMICKGLWSQQISAPERLHL